MFTWHSAHVEELYLNFIWPLPIKNVSAHGIHLFKIRVSRPIIHDRKFINLHISSQVRLKWRHHCTIQDTSRFLPAAPIISHCFCHIEMGSGFHIPLDINKTLMTTRDVLFTRYAIKCVLIPVRSTKRRFFHLFLSKLRLVHFRNVGILLCFFCRWYNAIFSSFRRHCVCLRSLKDTQIYYTFEILSEFTSKMKPFEYIWTGEKLISLIDLSKSGNSLRNVFHEIRI